MSLLFKNYSLTEFIYQLIRFNKTSPSCETHIIVVEVVYMSKTDTPHRERMITLERLIYC